ncbi:MAG: DUF4197 domain-containing protein [Terricaulis sp.]
MQRRVLLLALLAAGASTPAFALLDSLTQGDASRGIKDALALAATNATGRLGQTNGFWGAPRVRIPLPGLLGSAQQNLHRLGMSQPLDQLQQSLNHAAETTMPQAGRLFVSAVRSMTVSDAIGIVRGGDDSATQYLRGRTSAQLTTLLKPPMTTALTQSGAFTLMRGALRQVGMASQTTSMRTQIIDFSTSKALDGCFAYIGDEERAIRRDPVRRTTDILRRVFG